MYVQHSIALFQCYKINKACRLAHTSFDLHNSNSASLFILSVFNYFAFDSLENLTRVLRDPRSFTFHIVLHSLSI